MNALNRYLTRAKVKRVPPSKHRKDSRDDFMLNAMPVIALVLIGALYLGEWAYHATRDGVVLQMTAELRK